MIGATRLVRVGVVTAVAFALTALTLALPARGEVILHDNFDDSFSEEFEQCGLTLRNDIAFRGTTHLRVGKGDLASFFFLHLRLKQTETITNLANGRFLVIEANQVERDVRAQRVESSVFQVTSVVSGQPFVVRDMNGRVVLRDRGSIWFTALFDTGGDDVPGGDRLTDPEIVRISGPHPGSDLDDDGFCELVTDLIG